MTDLDTISKHFIHTYPADFVHFALQRNDVEVLEILDSLDTEQPTVQTRRADSLIRVRLDGQDALVHHEFQTTDSTPPMPQRMAGYIGRCIEQYGLPVYAHVLYLRPNAGRRDPGVYLQEHPDYPVIIRYKVLRLSQLDGRAVLDRGYVGLLPFAPLMQPPAGQTGEAWLAACVAKAAAVPLDRSVKGDFLTGLTFLSGLVYNPQTITALISKENLMDLIRESSFAQYLAQNFREEYIEQGIKQGIEQGIEQGGREFLLDVLALRFPPDQVRPLADRIEAINDVQRLKQLHRAAIQMPSLEAFSNLLDDSA